MTLGLVALFTGAVVVVVAFLFAGFFFCSWLLFYWLLALGGLLLLGWADLRGVRTL